MKSYESLVRRAIALNLTVSVFDGEEWAVKRSRIIDSILRAIESVEEAQLRFRKPDGSFNGWALVVPGLADDETVADYSMRDWIIEWDEELIAAEGI